MTVWDGYESLLLRAMQLESLAYVCVRAHELAASGSNRSTEHATRTRTQKATDSGSTLKISRSRCSIGLSPEGLETLRLRVYVFSHPPLDSHSLGLFALSTLMNGCLPVNKSDSIPLSMPQKCWIWASRTALSALQRRLRGEQKKPKNIPHPDSNARLIRDITVVHIEMVRSRNDPKLANCRDIFLGKSQ